MARPMKSTVKPDPPEVEKITGIKPAEDMRKQIKSDFDKLKKFEQLKLLEEIGVGSDFFTCSLCGKVHKREDFYVSTDPRVSCGRALIDTDCVTEIVTPTVNGERQPPTKKSVDDALYYLNKPFLESVWDTSMAEKNNENSGHVVSNVWNAYIKNIQMKQYYTLTYRESDNYTGGYYSMQDLAVDALPKDQEIMNQFEKNKNDTLRLLGYLPFEKEKLSDQPFLYSQLIGFLDSSEEGNDDMMRTSSIISIVRGFLQLSQIDDMIAEMTKDINNANKNIASIKAMQMMKQNITMNITKLAEQSCISLKNSKNATKGENTWTGKLKKIREINIRESANNGFDIDTCKGMQQVADISMGAIIRKLNLQEDEYADMIAEQRAKLKEAIDKANAYAEAVRILLAENIDLRELLEESNIDIKNNLIDLDDFLNTYIEGNESIEQRE